ncbi:LysR substrate-binding domain-containing protein [Leisingera aquimarina]|uniref:LysR substrate-binding domain-containing protein n=1 Tax=Leisingera aquimarina TaxID=476529 RepID=UPI000488E407|nr:LysR substrate-binding domain-containing protein [Leisingera aquimarina]
MTTHMPTLVSLRAFEAVARHKSFRKAADESCVTHAAVSHQIKALETSIGVQLLERTSRSVELTPAGEQYYPPIREHIQGIIKATRRIQAPDEPDVLLVQSYASFNTMWLQPRLADFLQDNPNTRVRIISTFEDGDYDAHRFDAGIFNAPPFDKRFNYSPLFETDIYPVCAPEALSDPDMGMTLDELESFLLLGVPTTPSDVDDWTCWLEAAGLSRDDMKFGSVFDNYPLVREAVLKNHGIGMARAPFCVRDLERGRLVRPFGLSVPEPSQWYLATPKNSAANPKLALFTKWLEEEIEADPTMRSIPADV